MSTVATSRARVWSARPQVSARFAIWASVLGSRLLVIAGAAAGALLAPSRYDSVTFDPAGVSRHLGSVGAVLAASTDRWDAVHYLSIAQHGYTTPVSAAFFPLYPLLIRLAAVITGSYVIAGVLISFIAFAIALELLYRLTDEELDGQVARGVVLLLAFAPLSLFFSAIYTESLFLALSVGVLYLTRHDRLVSASLAAAAASLTHIEGVLLLVPLAVCWWERQDRSRSLGALIRWRATPLTLPLLALSGLCLYMHANGFGWLAPISNEANPAWHHQLVGPVVGVAIAIKAGVLGLWQTLQGVPPIPRASSYALSHPFQNLVYLVLLAICVAALFQAWRRLPKVYAVYSGLYLAVLTSSPIPGRSLVSFDRYALVLFPLWIAAAAWLRERRLLRPVIQIGAVLLLCYSFQVGRWLFVA
ncbi:MAG: hypothetical protein KGL16_11285 [Acidobacteriota bacterium]|nr:hypothetical protein [Acidobacteriota bacterium]